MLKLLGDQDEAKTATTKTAVVLSSPTSLSQNSETRGELENRAIFTNSDDRTLAELTMAERRVADINACIDRQRQLVKKLAGSGKDITSAEIMLDSLLLSLFLAAEDRHRLRTILNTK